MTRDVLTDFLRKQPFQPIEITLSTGERRAIRHPELAMLGRNVLWLSSPQDDHFQTITLHHIVSAEPLRENQIPSVSSN